MLLIVSIIGPKVLRKTESNPNRHKRLINRKKAGLNGKLQGFQHQ